MKMIRSSSVRFPMRFATRFAMRFSTTCTVALAFVFLARLENKNSQLLTS